MSDDEAKDDRIILFNALKKTAINMGISCDDLAQILDVNTYNFKKIHDNEKISPNSAIGKRSLSIIKIYESLFTLSGNNHKVMKHWLSSENSYFNNKPIEALKSEEGIKLVHDFLNALKEKV